MSRSALPVRAGAALFTQQGPQVVKENHEAKDADIATDTRR